VTCLADASAVWRLLRGQLGSPWPDRVARGLVAICPPVETELMPGLRSDRDYEPFFTMLGQTFGWVPRWTTLGQRSSRCSGTWRRSAIIAAPPPSTS
jgi:hypothetical protein